MEDLKKGILIRNNVAVGAVGDKYFSTCPIGTVLSYAGQTAPRGFLVADGASYKVSDYADLYAVIGNTYGGDTENFNVPNLVDKFIQGSTTSGEEKEAGLPNITGLNAAIRISDTTSEPTGAFYRDKAANYAGNSEDLGSTISFDASLSNAIYGNSDTVQPPALTMVYIIKAFHTNEGADAGLNDETITLINQEIDNKTPTIDVQEIADGHSVTIVDKNGEQIFEVPNGKDGVLIDDTIIGGSTTTVWSSSKTKNYIDTANKPVTILASGKSSDTGWNLKRGTKYDFGRLLLVSAYNDSYSSTQLNGTGSELLLIMGDYETATVTSAVIAKTGKTIDSFYSLEVSSSGTLVIKTTSNLANSNTGKGKARLSFTFLN
jgi:microcystin-dependent protein